MVGPEAGRSTQWNAHTWGYIGLMERKWTLLYCNRVCNDFVGITENKMETTIGLWGGYWGLGFRVWDVV